MIRSIELENFRACQKTAMGNDRPLSVFTALVGRNGAGKTTVLKGIEWISKTATSQPSPHYPNGAGSILFDINDRSYAYEFSNLFTANVRREKLVVDENVVFELAGVNATIAEQHIRIPLGQSSFPILRATNLPEIETAYEFMRSIRYYPVDEPHDDDANLVIIPDSDLALPSPNQRNVGPVFVYLKEKRPEVFRELQAVLGKSTLDVVEIRIDEQRIAKSGGNTDRGWIVRFQSPGSSSFLPFGKLSFGTRRLIRIVTSVVLSAFESDVVMVEQIEEGIHSGLLRKFADTLESYTKPNQVFLTSHAAAVLDQTEAENIQIISNGPNGIQARGLSRTELTAAKAYLEHDGPLSDFLAIVIDE